MGVAFLLNAYIARYLGPANYGLLNYVFSLVGLFGFVASLGIESIAGREIVADHEKKYEIIGTSFYLKLCGSILAIVAVFFTAIWTTNDVTLRSLIMMYSLTYIFSAFNIIDTYFQSQVQSKYTAVVMIAASVISAILKISIIASGLGIIWLTAVYVLESSVNAFGSLTFFIWNRHNISELRFNRKIAKEILKDSWPLMLSTVAWSIYMRIDQVMIKNMLGNEEAGIYAVAAKLSEFWYFIPSIICASVFPAILNAKKTAEALYRSRLANLYSLMFYISGTIALGTTLFARPIIDILFGGQYLGAIITLRIYVWGGIASSVTCALGYYLISINKTRVNAIATAVGAFANVCLNLFLIPMYGIAGGALATFISYSAVTLAVLASKSGRSQILLIANGIALKTPRE